MVSMQKERGPSASKASPGGALDPGDGARLLIRTDLHV